MAALTGILAYFVFDITMESKWNTVLLCMMFIMIFAGFMGFFLNMIKKSESPLEPLPKPPPEPPLEESCVPAPLKPLPPAKSACAQLPIPVEPGYDVMEEPHETKKLREAKKAS